ncbi:MAG: hypothetical protein E7532_02435 [Ruminococcaceae bacterium]|nr:hypothetical protein [Oscillospiraceae bacterium]
MKKTIAIILAALMLLSMAACGTTSNTNDTQPATTAPAANTVGTKLLADFKTMADKTPQEIADTLLTNPEIQFMPMVMPVEEGFLNGFNEEIKGFKEGVMFGPAIGTIPFVGYIFTVEGDVDAFTKTLEDNANLRWNICTEAEEMICEAVGNTVFFVMCPTTFEEAPVDGGADVGGMEITPDDGAIAAEDGITLE